MTEQRYDYPAKNAVRDSWMRFLPPSFTNAQTHGLYLPGPENLEFDGYAAKGLTPDRLIGVEHDETRVKTVVRNARGIRLVHGDVADAVALAEKTRTPRLAFANLDFDGSYNTFLEDFLSLFRIFPAEEGGYLAVTSFAGRDDDTLAQGVANASKFLSGIPDAGFWGGYAQLRVRHTAFTKAVDPRTPDHTHMSRTLGLLWWVAMAMAVIDYPPDRYGTLDRAFLKRVGKTLDKITRRANAMARGTDFYLVNEKSLAATLRERPVMLWPTEFRQIIYYSKNNNPLQTRFMRIWVMRDGNRTAADLLEQVWNLAVAAPIQYYDKTGSLIEIKGK